MPRLSMGLLLMVAVLLTGCTTPAAVATRETEDVRRPENGDKPTASAAPPAASATATWMDEHTFAVCTGVVLLVVVVAGVLTGLAFSSVFGHWY